MPCAPLLDKNNYSCWKETMSAFIKSIGTEDAAGLKTVKSLKTWNTEEITVASHNFKALNAICNGIDESQVRLISKCDSTKDTWEILQITHERN